MQQLHTESGETEAQMSSWPQVLYLSNLTCPDKGLQWSPFTITFEDTYFKRVVQDSTDSSLGTSTSTVRGHNEIILAVMKKTRMKFRWASQSEWTFIFTIKQKNTYLIY